MPAKRRQAPEDLTATQRRKHVKTEANVDQDKTDTVPTRSLPGTAFTAHRAASSDVHIRLTGTGQADLVVNKDHLCDGSEYFRQFNRNGWPAGFALRKHSDPDRCIAVPDSEVTPENPFMYHAEYAALLNKKLFGLLLTTGPLDIESVNEDHSIVKDRILLAVRSWLEYNEEQFIRERPFDLLETAYVLEDSDLFRRVYSHAAGQWAAEEVEDKCRVSAYVGDMLDASATDGSMTVTRCIRRLVQPIEAEVDAPAHLARTLFQQHLLTRVIPHAPCSSASFKELTYITSLRTGLDLLGSPQAAGLLQAVGAMDSALVSVDASLTSRPSRNMNRRRAHSLVHAAISHDLSVTNIQVRLKIMIDGARGILKLVLSGDKNVDYFTFMEFDHLLPWEAAGIA